MCLPSPRELPPAGWRPVRPAGHQNHVRNPRHNRNQT